jgi:hypothetical protein
MLSEIFVNYRSLSVGLQYNVRRKDGCSPAEREKENTREVTSENPLFGAVMISSTCGIGIGVSDCCRCRRILYPETEVRKTRQSS